MSRSVYLANRIREVYLNGKWIANTNYKEQLSGLNADQAAHIAGDLNSIAVLTYHINYYLAGILNAMESGILDIRDQYSFDCPEVTTDVDWNKLLTEFLANAECFADKIERLKEEELDKDFFAEKYGTWLRNIDGLIEHSYYHLGQIVLIRKLIAMPTAH